MSAHPSCETDTALMLQTIPAFNRDKATLQGTDHPPALAPTDDLKERYEKLLRKADKLASDKSRLESEVAVLREQNKRARKKAKRNDSGEGSLGASGSPSPTKPAVPGGGSSMSASGPLAPSLNSGGGGPFFPQRRIAPCFARATSVMPATVLASAELSKSPISIRSRIRTRSSAVSTTWLFPLSTHSHRSLLLCALTTLSNLSQRRPRVSICACEDAEHRSPRLPEKPCAMAELRGTGRGVRGCVARAFDL